MNRLMRCLFCGLLQDEPEGVKACRRCGGELAFEAPPPPHSRGSYIAAFMELDQVNAPSKKTIDRHILVTLETPAEVPADFRASTESGRPALGFNVVLDVSGSMRGEKIAQTRQALHLAAKLLHDGDQFSLTVFSGDARQIIPPTPFNEKNRAAFEKAVNNLQAGGGTALHAGLDLGLQQARRMQTENNLTLLLSDGHANIGEKDLEIIGMLAKAAADQGQTVSTLGVGLDYNEALMTEIALQGRGRYYHVRSSDEIVPCLTGELGEAADLAAHDAVIRLDLPEKAALIPLSAAYTCEIQDRQAEIAIGDLPLDLTIEIPLRLTLFSGQSGERRRIEGQVTYHTPSGAHLAASLNPVTVRFVEEKHYAENLGVIQPVAAKVARQMRARQVLDYSRAFTRRDKAAIDQVQQQRERYQDYVQLLDEDTRREMLRGMEMDFDAVQSASPRSKEAVRQAYMANRFMRDLNEKK
jgi:Ca-activated chloride channel family protein